MTQEMNKWIRRLGDKAEDYLEHKWFDITGVDTPAGAEDLSTEYARLLETYKLPFDKTAVVGSVVGEEATLLLSLEGDYMEGGLRISATFKKGPVFAQIPEVVIKPVEGVRPTSMAHYKNGTREDPVVGPILASAVAMFYKALSTRVLPCAQPTPVNSFTNRRLKAQGKPLQYEWKTIEIGIVKPRKAHQGGTHAPPRLHERRGHLRKLKSGKQVWVKSCKVGDASRGTVFHDYAIKGIAV
jgi:hypothetical protein